MKKTLWIVGTVLWVGAAVLSSGLAMMSFMMFDAPGSTESRLTVALFLSVLSLPAWFLAGAVVPWIFYKKRVGPWLFLIPGIDLLAIGLFFVLIDSLCGGSLACR